MDIQAILPQINNAVNLSNNNIKLGDEFEKLLQHVNEDIDIVEMKKFLDEKFNVNTIVVDYSCAKTDIEAEMYDTAMLEKYNMYGGRNVIISKKALLRMKKDSAFRQKVYKSIEDMPWSSKLTGGVVKGDGVFIHDDGTGGYYMEFDWGDDDEKPKSKKHKALYTDVSEIKELNPAVLAELNDMELQADIFISLLGTNFNYKRDK
ncbi:MAG: DUF6033 family protein [Clostridiales bacterium]|nr:DUF6033 family protein [Clostridiales bacterium]